MRNAPRVQLSIIKAARARSTPGKPEALESLSEQRPPAGRSSTGAVKAAPELGARARLGHFRRGRNIRVLVDIGPQMSLPH
eukprot:300271-Alexandrium_andersonii.AAC.1